MCGAHRLSQGGPRVGGDRSETRRCPHSLLSQKLCPQSCSKPTSLEVCASLRRFPDRRGFSHLIRRGPLVLPAGCSAPRPLRRAHRDAHSHPDTLREKRFVVFMRRGKRKNPRLMGGEGENAKTPRWKHARWTKGKTQKHNVAFTVDGGDNAKNPRVTYSFRMRFGEGDNAKTPC